MTTSMTPFRNILTLMCMFLATSCSATNAKPEITLVGSTPCDESIKSMLSITASTKVDFIRWNLKLDNNNTFVLDITYGESQPNTLGFIDGGQKQNIKGTYLITKSEGNKRFKEVYQLKSDDLSENISFVKLTETVFHILTSQNELRRGNGGWSYSLNRKTPVDPGKILISSPVPDHKSSQHIYDGRTPCQEIASEHPEMNAGTSCFKIKWRLTLNRDTVTHQPTTCTIRNIVNNQPSDILGKWGVVNGTPENPNILIYKIKPDNLAGPILLFAGDGNVLFFVDKNYKPFRGNEDFSFVLNKKPQ